MAASKPAGRFYAGGLRRSGRIAARLEARAGTDSVRRPAIARPRATLLGPPTTWCVYPLQADALQRAAAAPTLALMTFACEARAPDGAGRRAYLVCHPKCFWHCDVQKEAGERCSYEVIPENAPCKLYMDLEFDRALNADKNGDALTALVIRMVVRAVDALFGIAVRRRNVINLTASSDRKCSHHLIFTDLVFRTNSNAGNFVKDMLRAICAGDADGLESLGLGEFSEQELSSLTVTGPDDSITSYIDASVYSRNRNFRLYLSTKYGKRRPLVRSAYNRFQAETEEEFFLASLVSYVPELPVAPLVYRRRIADGGRELRPPTCVPAADRESVVQPSSPVPPADTGSVMPPVREAPRIRSGSGTGRPSPYPLVDAFVRDLFVPFGRIRKWILYDDNQILVYGITGYRHCGNIGRWHRNNNIMIVVSTKDGTYYQKCHDPDCRSYRSNTLPLPTHLLPQTPRPPSCQVADPPQGEDVLMVQVAVEVLRGRQAAQSPYPITRVPFSAAVGGPATMPAAAPPPPSAAVPVGSAAAVAPATTVGGDKVPDRGTADEALWEEVDWSDVLPQPGTSGADQGPAAAGTGQTRADDNHLQVDASLWEDLPDEEVATADEVGDDVWEELPAELPF